MNNSEANSSETKLTTLLERYAYIDFLLDFKAVASFSDLEKRFGISDMAARRTIFSYAELVGQQPLQSKRGSSNIASSIVRWDDFKRGAYKDKLSSREYSGQALSQVSDTDYMRDVRDYLLCSYVPGSQRRLESPDIHAYILDESLNSPSADLAAALSRACQNRGGVYIKYVSEKAELSDPQDIWKLPSRLIFPHSLVFVHNRWHVRAFSPREDGGGKFQDFVLTRMELDHETTREQPVQARGPQLPEHDINWNNTFELELVIHPKILANTDRLNPKIVQVIRDFALERKVRSEYVDGVERELVYYATTRRVRSCLVGYHLLQWNVDCSEGYNLNENLYRLCLRNREILPLSETGYLAPGFGDARRS